MSSTASTIASAAAAASGLDALTPSPNSENMTLMAPAWAHAMQFIHWARNALLAALFSELLTAGSLGRTCSLNSENASANGFILDRSMTDRQGGARPDGERRGGR